MAQSGLDCRHGPDQLTQRGGCRNRERREDRQNHQNLIVLPLGRPTLDQGERLHHLTRLQVQNQRSSRVHHSGQLETLQQKRASRDPAEPEWTSNVQLQTDVDPIQTSNPDRDNESVQNFL